MSDTINRRQLAILAAGTAASGVLLGATSAEAYQGNMERALSDLYSAIASLREASSNKGGHRVRAMQLIQQAIDETQAGIEFADEHGGGGAQ
ncbi:MAG: hypothetical protein ABII76_27260 [Pseudomonadota bacterium]